MGLKESFMAMLQASREKQRLGEVGEEIRVDPAVLLQGHPKVHVLPGFAGTEYETRMGSAFGWFWLLFTTVHCGFMISGFFHGSLTSGRSHVAVASTVGTFLLMVLFYIPFFLVGFAFTMSRYVVVLTDEKVTVRFRILPTIGWTWELAAGDDMKVLLAIRGSSQNNKPVPAIVVTSGGKEINFGAFLKEDVKRHLAGLINDYYNGAKPVTAPFVV